MRVSYKKKLVKFSFPANSPPYEGQLFKVIVGKAKSCEVLVIKVNRKSALGDVSDCSYYKKIKRKQKLYLQEERLAMAEVGTALKTDITYNFLFGSYILAFTNNDLNTAVDGITFGGHYLFIGKVRARGSYTMYITDPASSSLSLGGDYVHPFRKDLAATAGIAFQSSSTGSTSKTTTPITLGGIYKMSKEWQLNGDLTIADGVNSITLGLDWFLFRQLGVQGKAVFGSGNGNSSTGLYIGGTYYNF